MERESLRPMGLPARQQAEEVKTRKIRDIGGANEPTCILQFLSRHCASLQAEMLVLFIHIAAITSRLRSWILSKDVSRCCAQLAVTCFQASIRCAKPYLPVDLFQDVLQSAWYRICI